jgi:glycerophosphoryl diester phosphodiesterase
MQGPRVDAIVPPDQALHSWLMKAPSSSPRPSPSSPSLSSFPKICGHRGSLFAYPENTLEGFDHCAKAGCDTVEFDVFILKDEELIVYHGQGPEHNPGE